MGGAPCKLLLNSGGVIGTLQGIGNVLLTDTVIPDDLLEEGETLICGFHKELQKFEAKLLAATGYKS